MTGPWGYKGKVRTVVSYDWDPTANGWTRIQNGSLHVDAAGRKVAPTNVIIQFVTYHDTGYRDSSGAEVPEADVVGTGDAWFLSAGYLSPVKWEKLDKDYVTTFRGLDGAYARLLPGRTWVELVPAGSGSATDRPADANDATRPVAPPAPDGSGPDPGADDDHHPAGRDHDDHGAARHDDHHATRPRCRRPPCPDRRSTPPTPRPTTTTHHDDHGVLVGGGRARQRGADRPAAPVRPGPGPAPPAALTDTRRSRSAVAVGQRRIP